MNRRIKVTGELRHDLNDHELAQELALIYWLQTKRKRRERRECEARARAKRARQREARS